MRPIKIIGRKMSAGARDSWWNTDKKFCFSLAGRNALCFCISQIQMASGYVVCSLDTKAAAASAMISAIL